VNITFLIKSADMSGGCRVIAFHARRLADHGHKVQLILPGWRPPTAIQRLKARFLGRTPLSLNRPSHYDSLGLDLRRGSSPDCIEVSDVPDADVVVATWWETVEWMLTFPSKKGVHTYFVQGHEVFDYLPIERVRATYTAGPQRIAVSGWLKSLIEKTYGGIVDLALNAVDPAVFRAEERGRQRVPTVGFVYTKTSWKRVDLIFEALRRLVVEFPDLRIVSFGERPFNQDPALASRMKYVVRPSAEEMPGLYAECDVWMTAANNEGFGLPAIEAMACRTPIVSSRSGWPVDVVVDGVNGYLSDVDDVDGLVSGARKILRLGDIQWRAMSAKAQQTAYRHTPEQSALQFEAALERAIQRGS
jgi:glycosyltransferase involved in cell wall biosynthesis